MLCSCTSSASYNTKLIDHASIDPKRILVVASSARDAKGNMDLFHHAIIDELRSCAVASDYMHFDMHEPTLSLDNDEAENSKRVNESVSRLNPDYLLTLRQIHINAVEPYDFKIELIDRAAKHTIWNGSVMLVGDGMLSTGPNTGVLLAKTLVQQLQQAGLLKSCSSSGE